MLSPSWTSSRSRPPALTFRRTPASPSLPRGLTDSMRPTAATIPVNIVLIPWLIRSRVGRRLRREARQNPHVVADPVDGMEVQAYAPLKRFRCDEIEHAHRVSAKQTRRQINQQLVDTAFAQQRAVQLVPGLDVQFVDLALAERP